MNHTAIAYLQASLQAAELAQKAAKSALFQATQLHNDEALDAYAQTAANAASYAAEAAKIAAANI